MTATADIETDAMPRGGRRKDRDAPERRCIATGESGDTARLIRFVLGPDAQAVPDLAGKLPGRGAWLTADRKLVDMAVKKRLFSRAFRQPVEVVPDLADRLEAALRARVLDLLGLARKAGQAVTGAEKVRARIKDGSVAVLLQASDGAPDGRAKLSALARAAGSGTIAEIDVLSAAELGLAFGREFAIHAALDAGGFAERVRTEAGRLAGLSTGATAAGTRTGEAAGDHSEQDVRGDGSAASGRNQNEGAVGAPREQDDT